MAVKWLIALHGPTASGKSDLAVRLALHFKTHIVSGDSRQFYRELAVGVARPPEADLKKVPHHFIACRSIHEPYSAGTFGEHALKLLTELFETKEIVITTGGSGLYLKALLNGLDNLPADPATRAALTETVNSEGLDVLRAELAQLDPEYYRQVDLNNPHRIIRALEVIRVSGKPYSQLRSGNTSPRPFRILQIGIHGEREWLNARISLRVGQMIRDGLKEEARAAYPFRHLDALRTVGYTEWFRCFDGELSEEQAIALIEQHTRQYAKRQMTWYRKQPGIQWFDAERPDLFDEVSNWISSEIA